MKRFRRKIHAWGFSRISRCCLVLLAMVPPASSFAASQPNILWITSEDNSPLLGCYGDTVAETPQIDQLAREGVRYSLAFSNAAVCAPARQTLISGMYASSIGGQHMRTGARYPEGVVFFPEYLREAGYYTTNNFKTDYNGSPSDKKAAMEAAWDDSSKSAHWSNRPEGKPFFAVFNVGETHESSLFPERWENKEPRTNPAAVELPAYLPDLPEVRLDMARYYDRIHRMDQQVGRVLEELEADGLSEDTIVFYFSDHGGSMPRGKSFAYDSGTRVPLIVRIPEKWAQLRPAAAGDVSDRMVGFVDFASTVLILAGLDAPEYMQGRAFLGSVEGEPRDFVHVFRGRRGERYDSVRGVRSAQFLYLRNYSPHLPVMQYNGYSYTIPSYQAWEDAYERGDCLPEQARWFAPKPREELYFVVEDPDNVRNLANDPQYAAVLMAHRAENERHLLAVRDSVFYPEGARGRRFEAYQNDETYPMKDLIKVTNTLDVSQLIEFMRSDHPLIRYWAVTGLLDRGEAARPAIPGLVECLEDEEPVTRLEAARALVALDQLEAAAPVLEHYLDVPGNFQTLRSLLVIDDFDLLERMPEWEPLVAKAQGAYTERLVEKILSE